MPFTMMLLGVECPPLQKNVWRNSAHTHKWHSTLSNPPLTLFPLSLVYPSPYPLPPLSLPRARKNGESHTHASLQRYGPSESIMQTDKEAKVEVIHCILCLDHCLLEF